MPNEDLRTRINSLSLQPWSYGHSYLNKINQRKESRELDKIGALSES